MSQAAVTAVRIQWPFQVLLMTDPVDSSAVDNAQNTLTTHNAIFLGTLIFIAAVSHALISRTSGTATQPLFVGTISGELLVRETNGVAQLKCNGFKIGCYESFAVVYVDREKEPTWTGNFVKTIPWSKIEYMTLADPNSRT